MLANGVDDGLSIRYFLRVLAVLRLNEMTLHDMKEYKLLIKKIEKKLNKLRLKPKVVTNRLQTIKLKIDKQLEQIKQNASQTATIDEFGSMSISESLSQSVSTERSQVDDTIFESASPNKDWNNCIFVLIAFIYLIPNIVSLNVSLYPCISIFLHIHSLF